MKRIPKAIPDIVARLDNGAELVYTYSDQFIQRDARWRRTLFLVLRGNRPERLLSRILSPDIKIVGLHHRRDGFTYVPVSGNVDDIRRLVSIHPVITGIDERYGTAGIHGTGSGEKPRVDKTRARQAAQTGERII